MQGLKGLRLITKYLSILQILLSIVSVIPIKAIAQVPPYPEISTCGTPLNIEYLEDHTSVVGFDDNLPYVLMYNGGGGGTFTLEGVSSVVPWFLPMSDQMMGYYNNDSITFELNKPFQTIRLFYPYGQGLKLEPNHDHTTQREFKDPNESWLNFIAEKVTDSDKNADSILGDFPTFFKPMFVGCLQNLTESEGVKFPMYANTSEEYPANKESATIHLTSIGAFLNTIRIVPPINHETDPSQRFFKTTARDQPLPPQVYEPEKVNCFDCTSWAGAACQPPNYKVIWPQAECENGKCDDDGKAAQNVALNGPPENIYVLFTYALTEVPYTKYRSSTGGDFRFTRALAKVPGIQAIEDKFTPTDHISKSGYYLTNTGGFTPLNPVNFPNKIYHEYQSDASSWCALQKSLSLRCDPNNPNFTGCWDYVGKPNEYATEKPANIALENAPPGYIAKWCEVAWRGVQNPLPPGF